MNKYKNPDKRCTHPFSTCPVDYCWQYATMVDEGKTQEEIIKECVNYGKCDLWEKET